jgi:ribosome recycling factor
MPIGQVASVNLIDSRTIGVQPFEKGMAAKIEKAIRESDLGLNPASMGDLLRVPMPPMSEERRKEMTKLVRHEAESAKVAIRNLRRDANDHARRLAKDKTISEDEERRSLDELQKLTDRTIAEVDRLISAKEAEIMAV